MSKAWVIGAVVLIMSGVLLVVQATSSKTSIVVTPHELALNPKDKRIERLRVAGKVSAGLPIDYQHEPITELRFGIEDPGTGGGGLISVVYRGVRPDMFAVGRDVIMDGDYDNGIFKAASLMTQCPSKYEPPKVGQETKSVAKD